MKNSKEVEMLGGSIDDALGEAFDKVAKIMGLSYPGGVQIENMAKNGNEDDFLLPKPLINTDNFNFSFSGLKTHINLLCKRNTVDEVFIKNLSASFQKTITEIILEKIRKGIKKLEDDKIFIRSISIVGGVANNEYIKKKIQSFFSKNDIEIYYPLKEMMSDNAAMIAWACIKNYNEKKNDIFFKPSAKMKINRNL